MGAAAASDVLARGALLHVLFGLVMAVAYVQMMRRVSGAARPG